MSSEHAASLRVHIGNGDGRLCNYCGAVTEDTEPVTVTDESGGGTARLCASCRAFATSPRCGLCGRSKSHRAKADALFFGLGKPEVDDDPVPICDGCRKDLLFNRGEQL
jgi:hypothetical protein